VAYFNVSRKFHSRISRNLTGQPIIKTRIDAGTLEIQSGSANKWTTMFGYDFCLWFAEMVRRWISSEQEVGSCSLTASVKPLNTTAVFVQFVQFISWTFVTSEAFAASVGGFGLCPNLGTPCSVSSGEIRSSDPYPEVPTPSPSPLAPEVCLPRKGTRYLKSALLGSSYLSKYEYIW
jgi:hypothetical protein